MNTKQIKSGYITGTNEMWKDIAGYEGMYQISSLGAIRSLDRVIETAWDKRILKGAQLKTYFNEHGYEIAGVRKQGVQKRFSIHRLVAAAFIPNPENKIQVNHINGIKSDNRVENLEWATQSENMKHSYRVGLHQRKGVKLGDHHNARKIEVLDVYNTHISFYDCIQLAAIELNIRADGISKVLRGKKNNYKGFIFKYA